MQARASRILFDYWNGVRGSRFAPRRLEIEPARIADILQDTFILERCDPRNWRYRLAGTRICDSFGGELRGGSFLDGWEEADRSELEHALTEVCQLGGVLRLELEARGTSPSRHAAFEAVLLPLVHMRPEADRLLGALSCLDAPAWLGGERLTFRRLTAKEIIWPDGRPRALLDGLNRQAPFLPEIRHARLVRSNRRQFRVYDGGRTSD